LTVGRKKEAEKRRPLARALLEKNHLVREGGGKKVVVFLFIEVEFRGGGVKRESLFL